MKRDEVIQALRGRVGDFRRYGVKSLAVFGSVARDEAVPGSDIDVLVEYEGKTTFDGYFDLLFYLEDALGMKVDLVTRRALKPAMRERVLREAIRVA